GPMDSVRGDAMKISLLAQIPLVLDEEPDLAFQHVIDLLRDGHVGFRVVARRPRGHHEAAFVAIGLFHDHRALSLVSTQYDFLYRNVFCFYAQGHKITILSSREIECVFLPSPWPSPTQRGEGNS